MRPEQALAVIQFEPGGPPPAPGEFRSAAWTNADMPQTCFPQRRASRAVYRLPCKRGEQG
jgi:hypothetical protein